MARTDEKLQQLLQTVQRKEMEKYTIGVAKVIAVDKIERSCSIEIDDDLILYNCRLNAVIADYKSQVLLIPKIGSNVIYIPFNGLEDSLILSMSEIDEAIIQVGSCSFTMINDSITVDAGEQGTVSIKNSHSNLYTILESLLDGIGRITVANSAGTTGPPINISEFQLLKTQLKTLMK